MQVRIVTTSTVAGFAPAIALLSLLLVGTPLPRPFAHTQTTPTVPEATKTTTPSTAATTTEPAVPPTGITGVGCQGRITPMRGRIARLAAPSDQGTPIVRELRVREGDNVTAGTIIAVLAAEEPARLLAEQAHTRHRQALAAKETAVAALEEAKFAEARIRAEATLSLIAARLALLASESEATAITAASKRFRASATDIAVAESVRDARAATAKRLAADRATLKEKLDAAVAAASIAASQPFWNSQKQLAAAALAEAEATRKLALAEHDARLAAADDELRIAQAQTTAVRSQHTIHEREPAEQTLAEQRVALARERVSAAEKQGNTTISEAKAALAKARHAVDEAAATVSATVAEARLATVRLELTRIRAPFEGTVLRIFATTGEAATSGIAEIADMNALGIEAEVAVADLPRVTIGAIAQISVPGITKSLSGKVRHIGLRAGTGTLADENPAAFRDLRIVPVFVELDTETRAKLFHLTGAQVTVRIER